MAKRHKRRYQSAPVNTPKIILTGRVWLQYREEPEDQPEKGDMLVFPSAEALNTIRQGEYDSTGVAGYFKVDVWDGKQWCPIILDSLFDTKQHYFRKHECPIDTYELIAPLLKSYSGREIQRTYREHYTLLTDAAHEA